MTKKIRPITPGLRFRIPPSFDAITTSKPEKSLVTTLKKSGGRNSSGKMTVRNVGGGHKRKIRIIDFKRNRDGIEARVKSIEYDPNRSANIALLHYIDGHKSYIIAPSGLAVGQKVISGDSAPIEIGNCLKLNDIPLGSVIHNIGLGKAGRNRWLGRRPRVRAVAMNPVDHPMGGGEGKASGGHPRSRNGLYSKGLKTRKKNKYSDKLIIKKRK